MTFRTPQPAGKFALLLSDLDARDIAPGDLILGIVESALLPIWRLRVAHAMR